MSALKTQNDKQVTKNGRKKKYTNDNTVQYCEKDTVTK